MVISVIIVVGQCSVHVFDSVKLVSIMSVAVHCTGASKNDGFLSR